MRLWGLGDIMVKNKKIILVGCMLLIICSVIGVAIHCNNQSIQYKEQQYLQIDGYRTITANSIKKKKVALTVETSLSLSQQEEMRLFEILENDCKLLKSNLRSDHEINVVIISDEYILSKNNGVIYNNGIVICNLIAFENKNYRTALVGAVLQTTEKWKQVAAAEYFFAEKSYENPLSELKSYYESNKDDLLLTLFQGYFNKDFVNDEILAIACKTAVSLGKYILDNYSLNDFINASLMDYRDEWLQNNGIEATFDVPYDLSWLDGAIYSEKFLQYPLVIETKNRIFYLDSFHSDRKSATFDTPQAVIAHLSNGYKGVNETLKYIQLDLETNQLTETIINNYNKRIEYYISSQERRTETNVDKGKVYLRDPSEFIHETMHILTMDGNRIDGAWFAEGVAEFLSREKSNVKSDIDYRMYNSFQSAEVTGDLKSFVQDVKVKYESLGGTFDSIETFKFYLVEQSIAYVTLTNPEYKQNIKFPYATTSVKDMRYLYSGDKGNDLTYPESYFIVKYLITNYGLDKVLSCCLDYNLEQIFGKTYEDIYLDFIKEIKD